MTTRRFSVLDEFFLQVETEHRPTHWALVFELEEPDGADEIARPATIELLRERVCERIGLYPMFRLGASGGDRRGPVLREYDIDAAVSCVESVGVDTDADWQELLSALLSRALPRDRPSWRLVLVDQGSPCRQRLVLLVHHSMSDGIAGAGYAGLFIDGDPAQLRQLDRYLRVDRYPGPSVSMRDFMPAARNLVSNWTGALTSRRLPHLTPARRRNVAVLEIPTAQVRGVAGTYSAGTAEFLVAAIGDALATASRETFPAERRPATVRAFLPATLDRSLRHSGNAVSMVLVNLPGGEVDLGIRVADARAQLSGISDAAAQLALPALSEMAAGLPWPARRFAARATLAALGPDVHVGINPAHLSLRSVLDQPVTGIHPLSPLFGNSVSFTCLVLGKELHIGLVWDPEAVGDIGSVLIRRLTETLSAAV